MKISIISAGAGGHAMAADLTLKGHAVTLYSNNAEKLSALRAKDGIDVTGIFGDKRVKIARFENDIAAAVRGADFVVLPVPGMMQETYLRQILPHLQKGQALFQTPGSGGALVAQRMLDELGKRDILLIDSLTLPYGARMIGPASVACVAHIKVLAAALPARRNDEAIALLKQCWEVQAATNVLETALMNVNPIIHPGPALLNWGWIEHRQRAMSIYSEGMSPGVLRALYKIDSERVAICKKAGVNEIPIDDIYTLLGLKPIYRMQTGLGKADRYEDRFIAEDVPFGLVTFSSVGKALGVATPCTDGVIALTGAVYEKDFHAIGRTSTALGLDGLSPAQITALLRDGKAA